MNDETQKAANKNRWVLLVLLAVFLAPALGSWLLYANLDKVHLGTTNKGEFVQPPRPVDATGLPLPADYFLHHLTLVYVGGAGCGADCRGALQAMQVSELALGENSRQVQRLYLASGAPDAEAKQDTGLTAVDGTGRAALAAFDGADAPKYVYLVDPKGYVVLRYPLSEDPKHILQDLRHLLGVSEG
ncbi:MAG TPA: hypothetical protein VF651_01215 [Gammaproteobacteria bacterium]